MTVLAWVKKKKFGNKVWVAPRWTELSWSWWLWAVYLLISCLLEISCYYFILFIKFYFKMSRWNRGKCGPGDRYKTRAYRLPERTGVGRNLLWPWVMTREFCVSTSGVWTHGYQGVLTGHLCTWLMTSGGCSPEAAGGFVPHIFQKAR